MISEAVEPIQENVVTEKLASEQVAPPASQRCAQRRGNTSGKPFRQVSAVVETEAEEAAPEAAANRFCG